MSNRLTKLARSERGATAIEYGLIVALIVIGIIASMSTLGSSSNGAWANLSTRVGAQLPSS